MGNKRIYEIAFVGLKPGVHTFDYTINDSFFEEYGEQELSNVNAVIKLHLDKNQGFMQLQFDVDGSGTSWCDRCGDDVNIRLWDEFKLMIKLVENPEEMNETEEDPDVFYIARTESHIDVKNWLYEFITLSFPSQKRCEDNMPQPKACNQAVLQKLQQMEDNVKAASQNPLWEGLQQLKNINKN